MFTNLKYTYVKAATLIVLLMLVSMPSCKEETEKETILQGAISILVDETIQPIIEDEVAVFESQYKAKIKLIDKPESEIINLLLTQKTGVAILSRTLTAEESKILIAKKIVPRITKFATDAIVFVSNKSSNDTIVELQEVINHLQGKPGKIKGLVFENPNSGIVRYMNDLAGVANGGKKAIYSLSSHKEVLKYIAENPGLIGVVGLNMVLQPDQGSQQYIDKINVMGVRNVKSKPNNTVYYKPNQSNLGAGLYPLQRDLYLLNYQGSAGLGTGFASFVAGEIGQRIILKSGLLPVKIPGRSIIIRKEIMNNK